MRLFPEIEFEEMKFRKVSREYAQNNEKIKQIYNIGGFWNDIKKRRNFFIEFAQKHNFDPLISDNWYNVNMSLVNGLQKV